MLLDVSPCSEADRSRDDRALPAEVAQEPVGLLTWSLAIVLGLYLLVTVAPLRLAYRVAGRRSARRRRDPVLRTMSLEARLRD